MPSIGSLCVGSFYSLLFLSYNHSPEKCYFPALKRPLLPQFSTYRHQTGFIVKRKQVRITNYRGLPINWLKKCKQIFNVAYVAKKMRTFQKIP